jgi:hypothetical protein
MPRKKLLPLNEVLDELIIEVVNEERLKVALTKLVNEAMEELKNEDSKKSCSELIDELNTELQKKNKEFCFEHDDAGNYVFKGCPPHCITLKHMYEDRFDLTYIKNGSERTKKLKVKQEDIKKFIKEAFGESSESYTSKAYNKVVGNSKDKTENKKDDGFKGKNKKTEEKPEEAVKDKKDFPTEPYRSVEKIEKQTDHGVKGTKPDYKYPKQKDKKLVVKLTSTKMPKKQTTD